MSMSRGKRRAAQAPTPPTLVLLLSLLSLLLPLLPLHAAEQPHEHPTQHEHPTKHEHSRNVAASHAHAHAHAHTHAHVHEHPHVAAAHSSYESSTAAFLKAAMTLKAQDGANAMQKTSRHSREAMPMPMAHGGGGGGGGGGGDGGVVGMAPARVEGSGKVFIPGSVYGDAPVVFDELGATLRYIIRETADELPHAASSDANNNNSTATVSNNYVIMTMANIQVGLGWW